MVGPTELGIDELAQLVRDPERLKRLARPRRWPEVVRAGLVVARVLILAGALASVVVDALDFVTAGVLAVVSLVGLSALRVVLVPPRGRKRDPYEEEAALAVIGAAVPNPLGQFMDEMRRETASGPAPVLSGPRPTCCPSCARRLEDPDGDDDAAAWFCHHCGASLLPEQDKVP